MITTAKPLFKLGMILSTPGALELLAQHNIPLSQLLQRHVNGDFGDLCEEDKQLNFDSIEDGSRIMSSYVISATEKVWIITEAIGDNGNRASTTALLPDEY